jgi:O-antigen/teichoic acid export membrane protein
MRRHLRDALWIAGGTAATALGTIAGVRVLTQYLPPERFGVVTLALGVSALALSLVGTPLNQAAMHWYPAMEPATAARDLLAALRRCLRRIAAWILLAAVAVTLTYWLLEHGSPLLGVLIILALAVDCWRFAHLSLLNSARRHARYVFWLTLDAWLRPVAAALAIYAFGTSALVVLGAYLLVSASLLWAFTRRLWPGAQLAPLTADKRQQLDRRIWRYALPLVPLGLIGWASSLGDRYVIGGLLSVADAGVYAAVYGVASAPFLMVGGMGEMALRPIHQAAVVGDDHRRAQHIARLWVAGVVLTCLLGVLLFGVGHQLIAGLVVGKMYRHASVLMPWIALGYTVRAASYVFERICYSYGQTGRVLVIQSVGLAAAAITTPIGVLTLGLKGAALSVPTYFTVQLLAAVLLAKRTVDEHAPLHDPLGASAIS